MTIKERRQSVAEWVRQLTCPNYCHWISYGSTSHIVRGNVIDVDRHRQGLLVLVDDEGKTRKVVWRCKPAFAERVIAGYYAAVLLAELEREKQEIKEEQANWVNDRVARYYVERQRNQDEERNRRTFILNTLKDEYGTAYASGRSDLLQTTTFDTGVVLDSYVAEDTVSEGA